MSSEERRPLPYVVEGEIGRGGMGVVYRAQDISLDRPVAIKVLPELVAGDEERRARFQREARTAAQLNHPNIATIYGVHEGELGPLVEQGQEVLFIAMEWVQGEDLESRLGGGPLAVEEALDLALQVCHALEAAHRVGVVHRDLKPHNIRITPEGQVKILDFGLAKTVEPKAGSQAEPGNVDTFYTREGMIVGTVPYMAPEQVEGRAVDGRCDLFALGVVLYRMLSGRLPFASESLVQYLRSLAREDPEPLSSTDPAISRRLADVVVRLLARRPENRYPSAENLRHDLEEILHGELLPGSRAASHGSHSQDRANGAALARDSAAPSRAASSHGRLGGPQSLAEPSRAESDDGRDPRSAGHIGTDPDLTPPRGRPYSLMILAMVLAASVLVAVITRPWTGRSEEGPRDMRLLPLGAFLDNADADPECREMLDELRRGLTGQPNLTVMDRAVAAGWAAGDQGDLLGRAAEQGADLVLSAECSRRASPIQPAADSQPTANSQPAELGSGRELEVVLRLTDLPTRAVLLEEVMHMPAAGQVHSDLRAELSYRLNRALEMLGETFDQPERNGNGPERALPTLFEAYRLFDGYQERAELSRARTQLAQVVEEFPDFALAKALLSQAIVRERSTRISPDELEEALGQARGALTLQPDLLVAALAEARALRHAPDQMQAALQQLEALQVTAPRDDRLLYELAITYRRLGLNDKARASYEAAMSRRPGYWRTRYQLALLLESMGQRGEAGQAALDALQRVQPGNFRPLTSLAMFSLQRGRFDQAKQALARIPEQADTPDLAELRGVTFYYLGQTEPAKRHYRRSLAVDRENPSAHNGLGDVLMLDGNSAEAQRSFETALAKNETRLEQEIGKTWHAALLAKLGRCGEALTLADDYGEARPRAVESRIALARALALCGREEQAETLLLEVLPYTSSARLQREPELSGLFAQEAFAQRVRASEAANQP